MAKKSKRTKGSSSKRRTTRQTKGSGAKRPPKRPPPRPRGRGRGKLGKHSQELAEGLIGLANPPALATIKVVQAARKVVKDITDELK